MQLSKVKKPKVQKFGSAKKRSKGSKQELNIEDFREGSNMNLGSEFGRP